MSFQTKDGRKLQVPLNKLISDDQELLKKHFKGKLPGLPELVAPSDLPYEQGVVHGPIDTGDGSKYFLYLPKSLSKDYKAPLFFWTGAAQTKSAAVLKTFSGRRGAQWHDHCGFGRKQ